MSSTVHVNRNGARVDDVVVLVDTCAARALMPRARSRVPARSCRVEARQRCLRFARGVAQTLAPRWPSGGLRAAAYRARSAQPSVPRGGLDMKPGSQAGFSCHRAYLPCPGSASRRNSSRRQTDTNRRRPASARRRCTRSRLARTTRRDGAPTGSRTARPGKERRTADPSEARASVGFAISSSFGIPHRPNTFAGPGRAHRLGRISLGASRV